MQLRNPCNDMNRELIHQRLKKARRSGCELRTFEYLLGQKPAVDLLTGHPMMVRDEITQNTKESNILARCVV